MPIKPAIQARVVFNRIPQVSAEITSGGAALCEQTADGIVVDAQGRVHVITGETQESIQRKGSGFESKVVAGGGAIFEEYGTVYRPAHPFLWPAVEAARSAYLAAWRALLNGAGRAGSVTVLPGRGTTKRRTGGRLPR